VQKSLFRSFHRYFLNKKNNGIGREEAVLNELFEEREGVKSSNEVYYIMLLVA
jgi:hypothetical protein